MKRYTGNIVGNSTFTISLNENEDVEVLLTNAGGGSHTITWVNVDVWLTTNGLAPTLTVAAGGSDLLTFSKTGGVVYGIPASNTGPAGAAGATGPAGLTWRGAYSAGGSYGVGDAVYQAGSSYYCVAANGPATTVVTPGSDSGTWSLLCAGGSGTSGGAPTIDNFQRANGLITAVAGTISWTKMLTPTASITSNLVQDDDTANNDCVYRAETPPLGLADHYAQLTLGPFTTGSTGGFLGLGVCVRFAAGAAPANQTYYLGIVERISGPEQFRIMKFVAGTPTTLTTVLLSSVGIAEAATGGVLKLAVSGTTTTTLTLFYNGAQVATATDSSSPITGNVRTGFHTYRQNATVGAAMAEFRYGT